MTSIGSPSPFFLAGKKAYSIDRSLRFNGADDAYLARTITSTGNRKTFTFSGWVKRSNITTSAVVRIFNCNITTNPGGTPGQEVTHVGFSTDDTIYFAAEDSSDNGYGVTVAKYRDPSAWMHLLYVVDTTESAAADRIKVFINGVQQTLTFTTNVAQNADTQTNLAGNVMSLGAIYFNGVLYKNSPFYLAEANFIDGQALTPSSFTETDVRTGQLIPKKYIGTYGTNGFYLNFSDNSGTTATTLGKDSSGNGNNFTPYNFSVSAGAGNDSLEDTPTNNFCTFNPLKVNASNPIVFSNGNLQHNGVSGDNHLRSSSTMQVNSGKWYVEFKFISGYEATNSTVSFGLTTDAANNRASNVDAFWYQNTDNFVAIAYRNNGVLQVFLEASSQSTLSGMPTFVNGDVMGLAVDLDNDKLFVSKNGTFFSNGTGTQDPAAGTNPVYSGGYLTSRKSDGFYFSVDGYSAQVVTADFGQQGYAYTPPSGFKKVNSANLPDPTIKLPNKHFDTVLYSGNGTDNRDITGLNFAPDWVWLKRRDGSMSHNLGDTVRGANKILFSDQTAAENTETDRIKAYNSDGFRLGTDSAVNFNGYTYVAWDWNAGDTDGKTYTVKVVSDSGNKYRFDDFGTSAVTLDLAESGTYIFDQSDSSNAGHPLRFSTTSNGTHGGGSEYTTGVTTAGTPGQSGAYTQIVVAASAPTLYYYCTQHSGMGGQVNTNSTLGSSNFDGSIQSTAKVNATAGFSVVGYTGTNGNGTIGHGLGVAPKAVILKRRDSTSNWVVFHASLGNTKRLVLNTTAAEESSSTYFNNTSPTSTTVSLGSNSSTNGSTDNYIAYVFSEIAGYSKFGSYTGNGNVDGTFVFTGFRPAWIMMKESSSTSRWSMYDNKRDTNNPNEIYLRAQTTNGDTTSVNNDVDFLSNGFKMRGTGEPNASSITYVYLAFAESPFKNARAR